MGIKIKLKSLNKKMLTNYETMLKGLFQTQHVTFSMFNLPSNKRRITILKSPHVYKKAREQFEIKNYKTIIMVKNLQHSILIKKILINKPKGVNISLIVF